MNNHLITRNPPNALEKLGVETSASRFFEISLSAFVALVLMSNNVLGPIAPVLILFSIVAFAIVHFQRIGMVIAVCWPLLILPTFALASILWSLSAEQTMRYGLYYLMTVFIGVILGSGIRSENMLRGAFWGLLVSGVIGLLAGRFVVVGTTGEMAFAGIQGSKNAAGEAAGFGLLVSGALAALAMKRRAIGSFCTALLGIVVASASLLLSKATGALIASLVASLFFLAWFLSRRLSLQVRTIILIMTALLMTLLMFISDYWVEQIFETVIEASGKDRGLTGRDLLWAKADALILERPWLGRGFNAFWIGNNLDAEYLWREMGISTKRGFNFHSTHREILVHLGYVGLFLFTFIFSMCCIVLIIRTMMHPSIALITASSLLVYFLFKLPFETFGFAGMHLLSMYLYTILAMGLSSMYKRT